MTYWIDRDLRTALGELLETAHRNGMSTADMGGVLVGAAFGLVAAELGPPKAAFWLACLAANPPLQPHTVN